MQISQPATPYHPYHLSIAAEASILYAVCSILYAVCSIIYALIIIRLLCFGKSLTMSPAPVPSTPYQLIPYPRCSNVRAVDGDVEWGWGVWAMELFRTR